MSSEIFKELFAAGDKQRFEEYLENNLPKPGSSFGTYILYRTLLRPGWEYIYANKISKQELYNHFMELSDLGAYDILEIAVKKEMVCGNKLAEYFHQHYRYSTQGWKVVFLMGAVRRHIHEARLGVEYYELYKRVKRAQREYGNLKYLRDNLELLDKMPAFHEYMRVMDRLQNDLAKHLPIESHLIKEILDIK